jgi:protoporphyrinogen oxidase
MGLAIAYELGRLGHIPVLFEADDRIGGMAACFDFGDLRLERYYHFHCLSDKAFFQLLEELDLQDKMRWKQTSMGFFFDGRLYPWGSAGSVLSFRRLPLLTRLRYLFHAARCLTIRSWQHLDGITATQWLKTWLGQKGFEVLWANLFAYKFYHFSDSLSAAWLWSRIRRIGQSRRRLKETLGYLEGGSQRWIDALESRILELGGEIRLSNPVTAIHSSNTASNSVAISTPSGRDCFDGVISTVPLPLVAPMLRAGGQDQELIALYLAQQSVACACVVIKTTRPITDNFWTNVNDARFAIPGIIEMANLQPLEPHITYVPFYMPAEHPDYGRPNQSFIDDSIACLKAINPTLQDSDILASHCSRYRFAQPVCGTHFLSSLPPLNPIPNVWIADTTVYYPEDRGISESIGFGRNLALRVVAAQLAGVAQE